MFRKIYKNANRYIDSASAYARVQKRLESEKKRRFHWQQYSAIAACLVIVVAGISIYEMKKPAKNDIIVPINEMVKTARIGEPDNAKEEAVPVRISVTEESSEAFEEILNDGSFEKRQEQEAVILEKNLDNVYVCWIKKDEKVKKIIGTDITDEEKENLIKSVLE